jgi:hypothetical protein
MGYFNKKLAKNLIVSYNISMSIEDALRKARASRVAKDERSFANAVIDAAKLRSHNRVASIPDSGTEEVQPEPTIIRRGPAPSGREEAVAHVDEVIAETNRAATPVRGIKIGGRDPATILISGKQGEFKKREPETG